MWRAGLSCLKTSDPASRHQSSALASSLVLISMTRWFFTSRDTHHPSSLSIMFVQHLARHGQAVDEELGDQHARQVRLIEIAVRLYGGEVSD